MRINGREANERRPMNLTVNVNKYAEGSVHIEVGDTKVICTATVEEKVPMFMKGQGKGWVTAEYSMLPRATHSRNQRESARGKQSGRTMEIQRLIGRALRSVVDLQALGERSITIDCDVLQADGGTRTTSITGAFVALALAVNKIVQKHSLPVFPITDYLASVSVGIVGQETLLDLHRLLQKSKSMSKFPNFPLVAGSYNNSGFLPIHQTPASGCLLPILSDTGPSASR